MKTMPYNLTIPTTPSVQTALLQSKSLTDIHDKSTVALTSGKKINTSYDNSTLFFKDMRLSERAQELNSVLDGLTNIVSTLTSTSNSIDTIMGLLAQANAAANSALDGQNYLAKLTGSNYKVTPDTILSDLPSVNAGDEIVLRTGDADKMESQYVINKDKTLDDLNIVRGDEFKIKIGDEDWISLTVIDENMTVSDFLGQVYTRNPGGNFQFDMTDQKLTVSTTDRSPIIMQGVVATALGFDLSTTHTVSIGSNWTVRTLTQAFSEIDGVSAIVNSEGRLEVSSIYGDNLIIDDLTGQSAYSFGLAGCDDGGSNTMKTYADQYNEILKQINNIVADSRFNSINLLEGDSIRAIFDEKGKDIRSVNGVKMDSRSLGLSEAVGDWQNKEDIQTTLDEIQNAIYQVRSATNKFDRASYMIQSRDSFLDTMADTCLTGAEKLTAADLNETAVQILAAETQKELVNNVISITMDTNASVLSLF